MCCRFIFRQVCAMFCAPSSNVLMYFLHVSRCVVVVVVVEAGCLDIATLSLKRYKSDVRPR